MKSTNLLFIIPKALGRKIKQKISNLESELKKLEISLEIIIKNELDAIYDRIAEGIRIRSKCNWYEHGEKLTKFFLNLEKLRSA